MKEINCELIIEEIQNSLDENTRIDNSVKVHLSECSGCREFYKISKKIKPNMKLFFNSKIVYMKKPDFGIILNQTERYRKIKFLKKLAFQITAVFIFITIGYSSFLFFNNLYTKIRLKNEISFFVKSVFKSSYFEDDKIKTNKNYYFTDWRNDFE